MEKDNGRQWLKDVEDKYSVTLTHEQLEFIRLDNITNQDRIEEVVRTTPERWDSFVEKYGFII